jgi:integrase
VKKKTNKGSTKVLAEAKVKEVAKAVIVKRPIRKIYEDSIGFKCAFGYDRYNKRVFVRLGKNKLFVNSVQECWNNYLSRNDTFGADLVTEMVLLDNRMASQKLKSHPSVTLVECVDFYIEHAMPEIGFVVNFPEAIDHYFDFQKNKELEATSSDPNHKNAKTYYDPIRKAFKGQTIISITRDKVEKYLKKMGKNWSARTYNNHRQAGVTMWNVLADKGYCSEALNPWEKADRKIEGSKRGKRKGSEKAVHQAVAEKYFKFLDEECTKYPSKYPELALSVVTWFCGIRLEEVHRIDWDSIDEDAEHIGKHEKDDYSGWSITVWDTQEKTRVTKVNPIPENAQHWLKICKVNWPEDELTYIAHPNWMRRKQQLWRKFKEQDGNSPLPQNTARHTWASHHLALYQDPTLTSQRLGHQESSRTLFEYYAAFAKPSHGKKYFQIYSKLKDIEDKIKVEQSRQNEIEQAIEESNIGEWTEHEGVIYPVMDPNIKYDDNIFDVVD